MREQPPIFRVVSLSHHHAPVAIRERFHLNEDQIRPLLLRMRDALGLQDVLILATCNRTEVYYADAHDRSREVIALLATEKGIAPTSSARYFQVLAGGAAVSYLFEVSVGLQSQIPGDLQIANQVKRAYALSHEAGMAGPLLHRMLHTIFHASKRVQHETEFRSGAASISYAAAELALREWNNSHPPRVLVLGLGEMGGDAARHLAKDRFEDIWVCNRTKAKAQSLAEEVGASILPYEELPFRLAEFDLIVSAVSVETPLVVPAWFINKPDQPRVIIDLSVPRSVHPDLPMAVPQVSLFDMDALRAQTEATLQRRWAEVPKVRSILESELAQFESWKQEASVSPVIRELKSALESLRKEEMERMLKTASPEAMEAVDAATKRMVNKLMKLPAIKLRDACRRGEQDTLVEAIRDLFDLERSRELK